MTKWKYKKEGNTEIWKTHIKAIIYDPPDTVEVVRKSGALGATFIGSFLFKSEREAKQFIKLLKKLNWSFTSEQIPLSASATDFWED